MNKSTVVVAMSGGVDSSVTAMLMKEQGHRVIGMFMNNWEEKDDEGHCHAAHDYEDVVRVCDKIGIPYYSVNFAKEYLDNVFSRFLEELKQGHTPNPDILCNREIKFKALLDKAMELGGDYLATGHYCQTRIVEGRPYLLRGLDTNKDQSYFLHAIDGQALRKALFPIGHLEKSTVRELARDFGLATAEKKDSTGICFIGKRNFKEFVNQYLPYQPGNFENLKGDVIGQHDGVAYYTIGQRRGLAIGGPGEAWFVVGKDIPRNVVLVEQGADHPALLSGGLTATEASWINDPPKAPFVCTAKVRYRQVDKPCIIEKIEGDTLTVKFPSPQRAVTPKQSVVFYDNDVCLGGAVIESASVYSDKFALLF